MASAFEQIVTTFGTTLYYFSRTKTRSSLGPITAISDGSGTAFEGWLRPTTEKDLEDYGGLVEVGDFLMNVDDAVVTATSITLKGIVGDAATPTKLWEIHTILKGGERTDHEGEVVPHLFALREQPMI